jgi:glycosyltransferase involved in cell wall biosynthesis
VRVMGVTVRTTVRVVPRAVTSDPAAAPQAEEVSVTRVVLLASARYPIRRPYAGGLEASTHRLATELRRRGHEVRLYASGDSDPDLGVTPILRRSRGLQLSPAAREDVSMVAEPFLAEHHAYLSAMLELAVDADVDVVHNHSLHYLPIAMAPALPCPLLTTLHTPPTPWLESAIATLPSPSNAAFVSVSDANARTWARPERIRDVVPNGIPVADWPFVADPGEHVAWMGRLVPEKAPHLAIDAAARAGVPIRLAGPVGDADYVAREVAPRLGPEATYVGHLDTAESADLVGHARACLVTPAWEEPYGLVVTEALACGTPVVGFARGALPELVDDDRGALVPPDDVDALAAAIALAGRRDRAACRRWVERHASLEAMTDRYESLYDELAG